MCINLRDKRHGQTGPQISTPPPPLTHSLTHTRFPIPKVPGPLWHFLGKVQRCLMGNDLSTAGQHPLSHTYTHINTHRHTRPIQSIPKRDSGTLVRLWPSIHQPCSLRLDQRHIVFLIHSYFITKESLSTPSATFQCDHWHGE